MFTGIITHFGTLERVTHNTQGKDNWVDMTIGVRANIDSNTIDIGASVAHNGVCLTITHKQQRGDYGYFESDVSSETVSKTTLGTWNKGMVINLERALKMGDELGGHLVSGHVDAMAPITDIAPEGDSHRFLFQMPTAFDTMIAPKGSIVINGVSLTVNEVTDTHFGVNIIPHTMQNTTFGKLSIGDMVNLEVDIMARYVAQYLSKKGF